MTTVRPLHKRLFVFSVPKREKIKGSVLYQPQKNRGSLSESTEAWILFRADDCTSEWPQGQKVIVQDGFELEYAHMDHLWDEFKDLPEFAGLRAFVQSVEGEVSCSVIAEGSILGVCEELATATIE